MLHLVDEGAYLLVLLQGFPAEIIVYFIKQVRFFFSEVLLQVAIPKIAYVFLYPGGIGLLFQALPYLPAA